MSHSSVAVARYLLDQASKAGRPLSPMKLVKLPNDLIEDHYTRLYEKYGASNAA